MHRDSRDIVSKNDAGWTWSTFMPGLIKEQRCSDYDSSTPLVDRSECCMQLSLSSVTRHCLWGSAAEHGYYNQWKVKKKESVTWFVPKLSHSSGVGCSQQVALVETENVLREVSTLYHNGSPLSTTPKIFAVMHQDSFKLWFISYYFS